MQHAWSSLFEMFAVTLGVLDGISPQYWSAPGQRTGVRWQRALRGGAAPLFTLAVIAALCVALDRVAPLGNAHLLFATGAGVILIGLAACSCFAIVADFANGDWSARPMNVLGAIVPARAHVVQDFIPVPGALAALCLALVVGRWQVSLIILASYAASFLLGTVAIASSEHSTPGGRIEEPSWLVSKFFVWAPILSSTLVVIAGAVIMHASLEIDSLYH